MRPVEPDAARPGADRRTLHLDAVAADGGVRETGLSNETSDPSEVLLRVWRALSRFQCVLSGFLVLVGSWYVFRYRSDYPVLAGYSWKYMAAVIAPFLLLAGGACLADRLPGFRLSGRRPGFMHALAASMPAPVGLVLAVMAPDPYVAVLMFILAAGLTASLWARCLRSPRPLLISLGPVLLACLMFAAEIPELVLRPATVVWGQESCFAMPAFPTKAPFIGKGGRLLGGLDARMEAPEYPAGARLVTNSIGLRNDTDIRTEAEPGVTRILSLGDSFSNGFAADQDRFYGPLLEQALEKRSTDPSGYEVWNAEVSDPAYGLRYLQQHGLGLNPDLVLYGLCGNDVMQAYWFAGPGRRFTLIDGRLCANPDYGGDPIPFYEQFRDRAYPRSRRVETIPASAPPQAGLVETLAAFRIFSGLFNLSLAYRSLPTVTKGFTGRYEAVDGRLRLFDGAANLGFYLDPAPPVVDRMYEVFFGLLNELDRTTRSAGGRFVLVLFPQRHQVQSGDWEAMASYWNLDRGDFDMEAPNRIIGGYCRENDIECVDLLDLFREHAGAGTLYLPGGDVHFNRRGHALAAEGVGAYLSTGRIE